MHRGRRRRRDGRPGRRVPASGLRTASSSTSCAFATAFGRVYKASVSGAYTEYQVLFRATC